MQMCKVELCKGFRIEYGDGIRNTKNEPICRVPIIENGEYGMVYCDTIPEARQFIDLASTSEYYCKPA